MSGNNAVRNHRPSHLCRHDVETEALLGVQFDEEASREDHALGLADPRYREADDLLSKLFAERQRRTARRNFLASLAERCRAHSTFGNTSPEVLEFLQPMLAAAQESIDEINKQYCEALAKRTEFLRLILEGK